jgi:hypothetical protein
LTFAELDTQLILAVELEYCTKLEVDNAFELIFELRRMLSAVRIKLQKAVKTEK